MDSFHIRGTLENLFKYTNHIEVEICRIIQWFIILYLKRYHKISNPPMNAIGTLMPT